MTPHFGSKLYYTNNLVLVLLYALLTYCSDKVASSEVSINHVQCVETERNALLHFKQAIRVDHCGYLDSWGHTQECCQWHGIHCNNQSGHVIGLKLSGYVIDYYYHYQPCLEGILSVSLLNLKHLKYLELSNNNFSGPLPNFIGSLASLEHLNLSRAGFGQVIPQEISNLSESTSQDFNNFKGRTESLRWLSRLRLIRELDLSYIDLSLTINTWLSVVNNLPFLRELRLDSCSLFLNLPPSLSYINSSTTLSVLSLSNNNLNDTSIFEWLLNLSGLETSLIHLDLSYNLEMFGNDLQLLESSMKLLDNLCNLQTLDLTDTNLNYKFNDILRSFSKCQNKKLVSLKLSKNQVWGSIPDSIGTFSFLRVLELYANQLNGTIAQSVGQLTMLEGLDLSDNSLNDTLTTSHLSNLYKLRVLNLYPNAEIVVKISANWISPFQLDTLNLKSCKIGPYFPRWITTQKYLSELDISDASISDTIPISFWNSSLWSGIRYLDMSNNMISGTIPDVSIIFDNLPTIKLGYNLLEGAIPSFLRNNVSILYLNNNKFSKGLIPFLCPQTQTHLSDLDLASNLFSEKLPDCWSYFDQLIHLHLENNSLWGSLPTSMGSLNQLVGLHLANNNLSGSLPEFLVNYKSLVILDLANNSFIGHIPPEFGHSFERLVILSLQSNRFVGVLPTSFCDLSYLQILDLSNNYISGTIPRCLYKLVSMANTKDESSPDVEDDARVMWKRNEQTFGRSYSLIDDDNPFRVFGYNNPLTLLKGIDISNNKLEGHIPDAISSLIGLTFLNLSRNNLTGGVVLRIGQLTSLDFLDLSHNHLSGELPPSLTQITRLSILDVSYNNLMGKIPVCTQLQSFDASSYIGNPGLCGAPLSKCAVDEAPAITPIEDGKQDTKDDFMLGLYISVVLGFIVGFWGVCGTLVIKRSWRHAYFRFYENTKDKIYVIWVAKIARAWT